MGFFRVYTVFGGGGEFASEFACEEKDDDDDDEEEEEEEEEETAVAEEEEEEDAEGEEEAEEADACGDATALLPLPFFPISAFAFTLAAVFLFVSFFFLPPRGVSSLRECTPSTAPPLALALAPELALLAWVWLLALRRALRPEAEGGGGVEWALTKSQGLKK